MEAFLLWFVTGYETWIHIFEEQMKSQWHGIIQILRRNQ
jgi:hypothetical protein